MRTWRSVRESLLASVRLWPGVKYRVELNVSSKWWLWRWVKRIWPPLRVACWCKIGKWWWWRLAAIAANRMAASWECGWARKKGEADAIGVDKPAHREKNKIHIIRKPQKGFEKKTKQIIMNERGAGGLKDLNNKNICWLIRACNTFWLRITNVRGSVSRMRMDLVGCSHWIKEGDKNNKPLAIQLRP